MHTLSTSTQDSGWLPISHLREGIPMVTLQAQVDGDHFARLSLDTGNADRLSVSEAFAKKINLAKTPVEADGEPKLSVGDDFEISLYDARLKSIQIGDWIQSEVDVRVANYVDYLANQLSADIDGNLGYQFFKDRVITLDYAENRIRFSPASEPMFDSVPIHIGEIPLIIVAAALNGDEPRQFILDTGAAATVLDPAYAERLGLAKGDEVPMMGATGMITAHYASDVAIDLAGRRVEKLQVTVADIIAPLAESCEVDLRGIIGYDFLCDSTVVFDYPNQRLSFMSRL